MQPSPVARLRRERPTCRPEFLGDKRLEAVGVIHPLIDGCVANTLRLENESLLLTGSNMSGKTTFLRTLILNALLGETVGFCFAERFRLPYCRIFSVIGLTDDLGQGTSYYLQEVLSVKRLLEAANRYTPCLFALDEPFKGTNTAERIAAGQAVLSHLNRSGQLVLVSTHDLELAVRLRSDGFVPYHFREEIADRRLTFDYRCTREYLPGTTPSASSNCTDIRPRSLPRRAGSVRNSPGQSRREIADVSDPRLLQHADDQREGIDQQAVDDRDAGHAKAAGQQRGRNIARLPHDAHRLQKTEQRVDDPGNQSQQADLPDPAGAFQAANNRQINSTVRSDMPSQPPSKKSWNIRKMFFEVLRELSRNQR